MNVLLIYCADGMMYRYFQIPSDRLSDFDLDKINGYYTGPPDDEDQRDVQIRALRALIRNNQFNEFENLSPINADKIVLIGSY